MTEKIHESKLNVGMVKCVWVSSQNICDGGFSLLIASELIKTNSFVTAVFRRAGRLHPFNLTAPPVQLVTNDIHTGRHTVGVSCPAAGRDRPAHGDRPTLDRARSVAASQLHLTVRHAAQTPDQDGRRRSGGRTGGQPGAPDRPAAHQPARSVSACGGAPLNTPSASHVSRAPAAGVARWPPPGALRPCRRF